MFCFQDLFSHHRHECCVSSIFQIDLPDGAVSPESCTLLGADQVFCILNLFFLYISSYSMLPKQLAILTTTNSTCSKSYEADHESIQLRAVLGNYCPLERTIVTLLLRYFLIYMTFLCCLLQDYVFVSWKYVCTGNISSKQN